ncbi:MAG: hypothetical protein JSU72_18085 [Deltaproteobacteria bacterium]|nr:MAG: hypothetical protein JSU72_18085 [Deltaproteobacteria bacterium]
MDDDRFMGEEELNAKLLGLLIECPVEADRKHCPLYAVRGMEISKKLGFWKKMNCRAKTKIWERHLECIET